MATAQYSENWFEHNIPHWEQWLADLRGRQGARALEIGSFEGRSTLWLCENILTADDSRIDCIDLFRADPVYGDYVQRFRANTAAHRARIREFAGPSFEMLRRVEGPYDIVYVDGWHSAFGALADGVMTWPLLKVGGVMIFDDYLWVPPKLGVPPRMGLIERKWAKWQGRDRKRIMLDRQIASVAVDTPKLGVDGLLATLDGYYELLGAEYQLAVRKTRDFDQGQLGHDT
ncbi:class I SAM-dependent methyltransferase [Montanilutibacter psychrotolerans]|uniref:Class I SAM-dependent methyltransferase n=1 Tax=Montanilutibacter psychrotolerans TaxID=1327343 RepID=A0A3M8SSW8_9GAMM|nr:class I SAM-dependent methyltransferase [Lysobacter psychrotolerans]RNF84389.1 class I SAM-dependent methyltransferase [Lysobacter psychrotolerans]